MLIFGRAKSEPTAPMTLRPEPEYFFMENGYRAQTPEECLEMYSKHEALYRERGILPLNNTGTYADYYFNRKYSSEFMAEMNRSAEVFIRRWCEEQR